MLAQELPILNEAAETLYQISLDDQIRQQCEAREDFFRHQRITERLIKHQKQELAEQERELAKQRAVIAEKDGRLRKMEEWLALEGIDSNGLF